MNWPALMAFGLGTLRLSPEVFWSMTPREFTAALGPLARPPAMTAQRLTALTQRFPDTTPDDR